MITDAEILAKFLREAIELLEDSRRYLTEFGSVDPGLLSGRIDAFLRDVVTTSARAQAERADAVLGPPFRAFRGQNSIAEQLARDSRT